MEEERQENPTTEDRFFNFRPACFAAAFLCLGITLGYFVILHGVSAWWAMLLLPVAVTPFCFCFTKRKAKRTALSILLLLFSFALGYFSFCRQIRAFREKPEFNGKAVVVGTVDNVQDYGGYLVLTFEDAYIGGKKIKGTLQANLLSSMAEEVGVADEVLLYGRVETDRSLTGRYGFRAAEIGDGRCYFLTSVQSFQVTGKTENWFLRVRLRLSQTVERGMNEESAAVTMAVLTGDTSGIERGTLENMRAGGIAHIFAVSGLHVGALYAFCLLLFRYTKIGDMPWVVRWALLAALLVFYGGVCGFSASVVRATVLCLVSYSTNLIGIQGDLLNTLGVSAFVVLGITPTALFEVGFQLSFAACAGIAVLAKSIGFFFDNLHLRILKMIGKEPVRVTDRSKEKPPSVAELFRRKTVSLVSASIAAQVATTPLLLSTYGYISVWSLLLNFFFVPFISATFAILLALVFAAACLPLSLASAILYLPSAVWSFVLLLFEAVDFSACTITGIVLLAPTKLIYYTGLIASSNKFRISVRARRRWRCLFLLAFLLCLAYTNGWF